MGYTIHYSPQTEKRFPPKKKETGGKYKRLILFLVLFFVAGMLVHRHKVLLWELLIPGDPEITVAAMETMAENLKEGMSLQTAVEAFCTEIFSYAPIH